MLVLWTTRLVQHLRTVTCFKKEDLRENLRRKYRMLLVYLGTGKTLVARALANECSKGDKRVAFFMRKGADCLSKWVGESERQLRLLFDQVSNMFFL